MAKHATPEPDDGDRNVQVDYDDKDRTVTVIQYGQPHGMSVTVAPLAQMLATIPRHVLADWLDGK